ncbi:AsmA-like C-terminal region-containing protein [Salinarimonas soli]|uniref:AsmA protein n=1 Tax=Salinarimonas soli TaxID=1638099 RepID=A0A5B2V9W7_9HYPH|nr:AsmA-like C-terminal region-containing protein [Salinarimonas soli]KAA2235518.1 AsmA protein [Salinarimonas soli]
MRDILTVLAIILIAALTAAVAAPPFVHWESYREIIDRGITQAAGTPAHTEGAIGIRLLPTPRIRIERLRLGEGAGPSLRAAELSSEIGLSSLLRGEVRFMDGQVERAEIRIPMGPDGRLLLPALGQGDVAERYALENFSIGQLLVTAFAPQTGRTDQIHAEDVRISGPSLAGPWRVEGRTGTFPFRLASGLPGRDGAVPIRLGGGGGANPRLDLDARLSFDRKGEGVAPQLAGTARLAAGPPAQEAEAFPLPAAAAGEFRMAGRVVELDKLAIDLGEGPTGARLTGTGRFTLDDPLLALTLEGRRLDLDSLLATAGGAALRERVAQGTLPPRGVPVALDLSLGSVGYLGEELTGVRLSGRSAAEGLRLDAFEVTAPGQTTLALSGQGGALGTGFTGQARVSSKAPDRFGLFLSRLGLSEPATAAIPGAPFEAEAGITVSPPVISLRNLRVEAAGAALTGTVRYSDRDGFKRPRLDAQIATQGLDLSDLPRLDGIFALGEGLDLGLTLEARGVRYAGAGAGRILARIASEGRALRIEELQVEDLAGAEARVSGRLLPDGSGRIDGRIRAKHAAPVIDGLAAFAADAPLGLVPAFVREGALDLALSAERTVPVAGGSAPGLRTSLKGTVAGGPFEAQLLAADGMPQSLDVSLQTADTARWLGQAHPLVAGKPSALTLQGKRTGPGRFTVSANGDLAGLRLSTVRPFAYLNEEGVLDAGEATLATADLRPVLLLLGAGDAAGAPVPADLRLSLSRDRASSVLAAGGRIAGEPVQARLTGTGLRDIAGEVSLGAVSVPWLVQTFATGPVAEPRPGNLWSNAAFAAPRRPALEGAVGVRAARLDLGRGLEARDARFQLAATRDGLALRDLTAGLAGGQVAGTATLGRQGARLSLVGEGSVADIPLADLLGAGAPAGRLTGQVNLGGAGESPAALVANLAGEGRASIAGLALPSAAPAAVERTLTRVLAESDPLNPRRLADTLDAELARSPFTVPRLDAAMTVVNGVMRANPVDLAASGAAWQGAVSLDLRNLTVEARGLLTGGVAPKGWSGPLPAVALAWRGPVRGLRREADPGPLTNGLAAIVLQRELERIELFEMEANERARLQQRLGMERQRREDARRAQEEAARRAQEEAARRAIEERQAREAQAEAERQARIRAQQEAERARQEADRARIEERRRQETEAAARKAAEDAERRRAAEETQRRRREAEAARRAAEEAELKRLIEETQREINRAPARPPEPPPPI